SSTSGKAVGVTFTFALANQGIAQYVEQITPVAILHRVTEFLQLSRVDVAKPIGDLLGASDLQSLPSLDRLDVLGRRQTRFMRSRVVQAHSEPHYFDRKLALL